MVVQVNPRLLCLFLLEELVGLDPPLTGLLRLWAGKSHLQNKKQLKELIKKIMNYFKIHHVLAVECKTVKWGRQKASSLEQKDPA